MYASSTHWVRGRSSKPSSSKKSSRTISATSDAGDDGEGDRRPAAGTPVNRGAVERQPARPDDDVLLLFARSAARSVRGRTRRRQHAAAGSGKRRRSARGSITAARARIGSGRRPARSSGPGVATRTRRTARAARQRRARAPRPHPPRSGAGAATPLPALPAEPLRRRSISFALRSRSYPDGNPAGGSPASLSRPILPLPNGIAIGDREPPRRRGRTRPAADAERSAAPAQLNSTPRATERHTDDCNLDPGTVEALRRDQRGRRADVQRAQGHHHRLPGAERCRQDDDAPDAARACDSHRRDRDHRRPALRRASRPLPARRRGAGDDRVPSGPQGARSPSRSRRRGGCAAAAGRRGARARRTRRTPPRNASKGSRSGCASVSASRQRCSASPRS